MIDKGADCKIKTYKGNSILTERIWYRIPDKKCMILIEKMLKNGAEIDKFTNGESPLDITAKFITLENIDEIIVLILDKMKIKDYENKNIEDINIRIADYIKNIVSINFDNKLVLYFYKYGYKLYGDTMDYWAVLKFKEIAGLQENYRFIKHFTDLPYEKFLSKNSNGETLMSMLEKKGLYNMIMDCPVKKSLESIKRIENENLERYFPTVKIENNNIVIECDFKYINNKDFDKFGLPKLKVVRQAYNHIK